MKTVQIPLSKSLANRNLILQSFGDNLLPTQPPTQAEDVVDLHQALQQFQNGESHFKIRHGGTSLRFLLARISRRPGSYKVEVSERLASRPINELISALRALEVSVLFTDSIFKLESKGWKKPQAAIELDCKRSTQFASSVLLSSLGLDFEIQFEITDIMGSLPYLEMTLKTLQRAGLEFEFDGRNLRIPPQPKPTLLTVDEIDLSSAFSLVACLAQQSAVELEDYPAQSLQADAVFPELLARIGFQSERHGCFSQYTPPLRSLETDLKNCPDLFPVLAALCALSPETSRLSGLHNLIYKESDRVAKTEELLQKAGAFTRIHNQDLLEIRGPINTKMSFTFDPDHDHRMAMAAAVLKVAGVKINIENPEVVNKSLPNFFELVGVQP